MNLCFFTSAKEMFCNVLPFTWSNNWIWQDLDREKARIGECANSLQGGIAVDPPHKFCSESRRQGSQRAGMIRSRNKGRYRGTACGISSANRFALITDFRFPAPALPPTGSENLRSTKRISATIDTCGSQPCTADFITNLFLSR